MKFITIEEDNENKGSIYQYNKLSFDCDFKILEQQYETQVSNMNDYVRTHTIEMYDLFNKNAINFKNDYVKVFNEYIKNNLEKSKHDSYFDNLIKYYNEKLTKLYEKYDDLIVEFRKSVDANNKRKLKTIIPHDNYDEEKFKNLEPEYVQSLVKKTLMNDDTYDIIKDIESRHLEILSLEKSVTELHELFKDLALLTELNQDKLNVIEVNVNNAKKSASKGENELIIAEKYSKKSKKTMCILLLILLIIIALIVGLSSLKYS